MRRLISMREALEDPEVFGRILPGHSWAYWRAVLIASQGEPLKPEELDIYRELSGRSEAPTKPFKELWAVCGRRAGKTRALAVGASYFARLIDYSDSFGPGQRGRLPIMAAAKDTAREAFNYLLGIFLEVPCFTEMLDGEPTADTIRLLNRVDIQVMTANYRTVRGPTPVAAICDEIAFWHIEGAANPDKAVLNALRPGLATLGSPLFVLSSPYARKGELWRAYDRHYGNDASSRVLVVQAPTLTMHKSATLADERAEAFTDDPASAAAEWDAEFRKDIEAFVSIEQVRACIEGKATEHPPEPGRRYQAFVDVSGGGADAMDLAIAHREGKLAVLDVVREVPPGTSPAKVVEIFADILKAYGVRRVRGDRYGKEWVQERFREAGITYEESTLSKSQIYAAWLPVLNSQMCRLLPIPKLEQQLVSLERKTSRGTGQDIIDHPQRKGAHDDMANAACGAIVMCSQGSQPLIVSKEAVEQTRSWRPKPKPMFARTRW